MPVVDSSQVEAHEIQPNLVMRRLVSQDPEEQKKSRALATSTLRIGELEVGPGASIGPHSHSTNDEVMIVIEGDLEFTLGEEVFHLSKGQAV
ncbi:cupin domain-containing protein [Pseudorhodoplanes sp.]|uniref:cupin domain-containing protein n=1 Tax=Pseudorhodoplanes sp. TaxID=1934341 RepID=UPI003D09C91D